MTERHSGRENRVGASIVTDGVENEKVLEADAVVGELVNVIKAEIDNLLADGVVSLGEVVYGVLLTRDKLL